MDLLFVVGQQNGFGRFGVFVSDPNSVANVVLGDLA